MLHRHTSSSVAFCLATTFSLYALPLIAAEAGQPADKAVSIAISVIANNALAYAGVLAAAGTVSMAFVELFKALTDLRSRFQQSLLNKWLGAEKADILPELLYLAIGDKSHESVLCGQPIEKMMGQLQAAARIALDYPEQFPHLFKFLTSTDFETAPEESSIKSVAPADRTIWMSHAKAVRDLSIHLQGAHPGAAAPGDRGQPAQAASDAAQARARLASLVGRKLDGFQLRADFWWSRTNQILGMALSIFIMVVAARNGLGVSGGEALAIGVLGGLLAPFAKDFSQSLATFASK